MLKGNINIGGKISIGKQNKKIKKGHALLFFYNI